MTLFWIYVISLHIYLSCSETHPPDSVKDRKKKWNCLEKHELLLGLKVASLLTIELVQRSINKKKYNQDSFCVDIVELVLNEDLKGKSSQYIFKY